MSVDRGVTVRFPAIPHRVGPDKWKGTALSSSCGESNFADSGDVDSVDSVDSVDMIAARKLLDDKLTELSTALEFVGIVVNDAMVQIARLAENIEENGNG